ncbi:hypothetical protein [Streptomyces sp. C8S0]|uniref:hypothetical protein n=1 Tax=Streptomyces sp. C8S0 TaxID=2585716 RepID=UPI0018660F52|nr:hypothetical protein [Streptomyces sp. C8S0]
MHAPDRRWRRRRPGRLGGVAAYEPDVGPAAQVDKVELLRAGAGGLLGHVQGTSLAREGEAAVDNDPGKQPQGGADADDKRGDLPAVVPHRCRNAGAGSFDLVVHGALR